MKRLLIAASIGHAVWFSRDEGMTWARPQTTRGGLYNDARAWCVATHAARPDELIAGTDQGLYRWSERAQRWRHVPSPLDRLQILKVARAQQDPAIIVAGTRPAALFVSRDDGATWMRGALPVASECFFINTPRVTSIQFDPFEPETIWATIEIAGVFVSQDGGRTWAERNRGLRDPDVHNLVIFDRGSGRELLASTEVGLHASNDDGATWTFVDVPAAGDDLYFRCMAARPDGSGTIFLSIGDRPSGLVGRLLRSDDWGDTWREIVLEPAPGTTIWWIGGNTADPAYLVACTIFGEVWISENGGETWLRSPRMLGELREIAWMPLA